MSLDNAILIMKFKDQVFYSEGCAIENIECLPDYKGYNKKYLQYWILGKNAIKCKTLEHAVNYAAFMYKSHEIERGIFIREIDVTFEEFKKEPLIKENENQPEYFFPKTPIFC